MLSELSPDSTLVVLVVLVLLLMGIVVESARILASSTAAALRGLARVLGAIFFLAVISALLVVALIR